MPSAALSPLASQEHVSENGFSQADVLVVETGMPSKVKRRTDYTKHTRMAGMKWKCSGKPRQQAILKYQVEILSYF